MMSSTGKTPKWATMPIPYFINESGAADIVNKSDLSAVRAAFQTWQNVAGANVQFDYQGTTPENKTGKDGKNIVTFSDRSIALGPSVVAVTLSFFKEDGDAYQYEEADILFNPLFDFATDGNANKYDIQAVATHEI